MRTLSVRLLKRSWDSIAYYARGIYQHVDQHHVFLMSGGLAFSLFTCIIPLVLIVFAVLGSILAEPDAVAAVDNFIDRVIPYEDYAADVKRLVTSRILQFSSGREVAGFLGLVGLFLASSGLFSSMRTILNAVFHVRDAESVVAGKLWDFGLVVVVMVFFILSVVVLPAWDAALEAAGRFEWLSRIGGEYTYGFLTNVVSLLIVFTGFLVIYWLVPLRKPNWRLAVTSALVASILWHGAKEAFGYYISRGATVVHIYGAYTFLVVAAFWIYYSSLVFVLAAVVGHLSGERRKHSRHD
jgi:membrane protein